MEYERRNWIPSLTRLREPFTLNERRKGKGDAEEKKEGSSCKNTIKAKMEKIVVLKEKEKYDGNMNKRLTKGVY